MTEPPRPGLQWLAEVLTQRPSFPNYGRLPATAVQRCLVWLSAAGNWVAAQVVVVAGPAIFRDGCGFVSNEFISYCEELRPSDHPVCLLSVTQ